MPGRFHDSLSPNANGAGERNRTPDRLITNQLLYLLSYASFVGSVRGIPKTPAFEAAASWRQCASSSSFWDSHNLKPSKTKSGFVSAESPNSMSASAPPPVNSGR